MGKPIILGVEGQAKELLDEFGAGVYFEPENMNEFIEVVNRLKDDTELYKNLSKNAVKLAQAYDRKALAKEMLDVIQSKALIRKKSG